MTDDLINSVLFYFICGTLDVFITISCVLTDVCVEANPIWNWIHPRELMLIICVFANLVLCLFIFSIIPYLQRKHPIYRTVIKCGLYGEGLGRVAFGAIPGILLIFNVGWF